VQGKAYFAHMVTSNEYQGTETGKTSLPAPDGTGRQEKGNSTDISASLPGTANAPAHCLKLLRRGFAIFPVAHRTKCPLTGHGFKDATRDARQVAVWAQQFPNCNWGISLGVQSGCFVLDFDSKDGAVNFESDHGSFPLTYVVKTSRGTHHYYRLPASGINTIKFDGGELRSDGAYVVSEGSTHETGTTYECISDVPIAEISTELLNHFQSGLFPRRPPVQGSILKGIRNDSLFHIACGAARNGATEAGLLQLVQIENSRCVPPLPERELQAIVKSVVKHYARAKDESAATPSQTSPQSEPETIDGAALLDSVKLYKTSCCEKQGSGFAFRDFSTFCAKAIAGIGKLPDTVADRAISLRLKRAFGGEKIERFRRHSFEGDAERLRKLIAAWCASNMQQLTDARPQLPEELSDRQQDAAEPLLAIADAAGGDWPDAARNSLKSLCNESHKSDDSTGVQLLVDVRGVFGTLGVERISSINLIGRLAEIETSLWAEWSKGRPITTAKLANLLRAFEIAPHNIRVEGVVVKGYEVGDFREAWSRYLRSAHSIAQQADDVTTAKCCDVSKIGLERSATSQIAVAAQNATEPALHAACSGVAAASQPAETGPFIEVDV
jgi:hypothetical protein